MTLAPGIMTSYTQFFFQNLALELLYERKHIMAQYKQFKNILYSIQQEIIIVLVCTTGVKSEPGRTGPFSKWHDARKHDPPKIVL